MKRETFLGLCAVVVVVVVVLAIFWTVDGRPAVDGLQTLIDVMEGR